MSEYQELMSKINKDPTVWTVDDVCEFLKH